MWRATGVEPTELIASTPGCSRSASTATLSPWTTLNTPSGSPASSHHSERLANRVTVDISRHVLGELALEQVRDAAGELDHLNAAGNFAHGVGQHLAVLRRDGARQLMSALVQQGAIGKEDARALGQRRC